MHNLYRYTCRELKDIEDKAASGDLSMQELEYADKLIDMKKNILKTWMLEGRQDASYDYSERSYRGSYDWGNRGGNGNMDGESLYDGRMDPDRSFARGRRYARRDSMGRYSRSGSIDKMVQELHELVPELPEDKRQDLQKLIHTLEQM